ncbi:hypothetical protein Q3G72_021061 [Acer saccharum]|nr:hypothetical protein Q3G72_021061 [Acer saccharum]
MELHTCYNIKTEDEPVKVKPTPLEYDDEHDELEEFFQAFEEEVRLLKKEKEGRMIESDVIEDKIVDAKDINLIKEIDILEKEKEETLKIGKAEDAARRYCEYKLVDFQSEVTVGSTGKCASRERLEGHQRNQKTKSQCNLKFNYEPKL